MPPPTDERAGFPIDRLSARTSATASWPRSTTTQDTPSSVAGAGSEGPTRDFIDNCTKLGEANQMSRFVAAPRPHPLVYNVLIVAVN